MVVTMTRSGDIVSLPYDLRIQFARYLVRTKLTQLKRYSFGKVKTYLIGQCKSCYLNIGL